MNDSLHADVFNCNATGDQNRCAQFTEIRPLSMGILTQEQFDTELEKGISDLTAGKVVSAEDVADRMQRDYGI